VVRFFKLGLFCFLPPPTVAFHGVFPPHKMNSFCVCGGFFFFNLFSRGTKSPLFNRRGDVSTFFHPFLFPFKFELFFPASLGSLSETLLFSVWGGGVYLKLLGTLFPNGVFFSLVFSCSPSLLSSGRSQQTTPGPVSPTSVVRGCYTTPLLGLPPVSLPPTFREMGAQVPRRFFCLYPASTPPRFRSACLP